MNRKQILKKDILEAISKINTLKASDNLQVKELYSNLTNRFRKLERNDFVIQSHYEIYLRMLKVPKDLYLMELEALRNGEEYATCDNYFQIKMSMIGYLGWLSNDY